MVVVVVFCVFVIVEIIVIVFVKVFRIAVVFGVVRIVSGGFLLFLEFFAGFLHRFGIVFEERKAGNVALPVLIGDGGNGFGPAVGIIPAIGFGSPSIRNLLVRMLSFSVILI